MVTSVFTENAAAVPYWAPDTPSRGCRGTAVHLHARSKLRVEARYTGPDMQRGATVPRAQPVRASGSLELCVTTAQTTATTLRLGIRSNAVSDLDRAVADPTGRNISLTTGDPTAGASVAGPNAALDSTPSSADLQLREDRRKLQLRASDQVIPHHDRSRQAPNPRERRSIWSCRCTSPLRVQTRW